MTAVDPTTLAGSLHDIRAFIHRYVWLTTDEATLVTLWAAQTHGLDAFDYCPYLHITSPLPECGKTRLLEILAALVAKPWMTGRVSAAMLMRKIDKEQPTLLLDESDAAFNGDEHYSEALRATLNLGFHRSGTASVCVGQGATISYKDFSVFGPKAIAGIGRLPSTVESRSIPIALKRRMKGEWVKKWRHRDGQAEASEIRDRIAAAMQGKLDALRRARPTMPNGLSDRAEDVLEPLFAIADLAGGEWPEPVQAAAVRLMGHEARQAREADLNLPLELLTDIQRIFVALGEPDAVPTKTLIDKLVELDERPWATMGRSEKPITGHRISRLLKGFGIQPGGTLRDGDETFKGYRGSVFVDAFARYVDVKASHGNNLNESGPESPKTQASQTSGVTLSKTAVDPDKHWVCDAVTLSNPVQEENDCCEGGPLQLHCRLCRHSPTYWQGRPH